MGVGKARRYIDGAVIVVFVCFASVVVLRVGFAPSRSTETVAVVFAPWSSPEDTLTRAVAAGGRFVRYGGMSFIAVVAPDAPDYAEKARANDALLVVDARLLLACLGAVSQ